MIQNEVRAYVRDPDLGRARSQVLSEDQEGFTEEQLDEMERGYIDIERQAHLDGVEMETMGQPHESNDQVDVPDKRLSLKERDQRQGRAVDVVLSDMSEPWDQTAGFYKKSLSDPYFRMMNTSGNAFRDHAGSMVRLLAVIVVDHSLTNAGPVHGRTDVLLRHTQDGRALSLQVLPGGRREGIRDEAEAVVRQGPPREA